MLTRRSMLRGLAASALGLVFPPPRRLMQVHAAIEPIEQSYDIVVVGAGAAGLSAALGALREDPDASVLVLDSAAAAGGTTYRSGGRMWIPNNADLRAAGLRDPREEALKYMARVAYPSRYRPSERHLGIGRRHHSLLGAYYDNGAEILEYYRTNEILPWRAERMTLFPWASDPQGLEGSFVPDYYPAIPENVPRKARTIMPEQFEPSGATTLEDGARLPNYTASLKGPDLIEWLRRAAVRRGATFVFNARADDLIIAPGARADRTVRGVVAATTIDGDPTPIRRVYRARRGVVFAAGGFSKNSDKLSENFDGDRALTGGGCAVTTADGSLVDIATRYGFMIENMGEAWFIENVYEQYKKDPDSRMGPNYLFFQAYWLNGDSMIVVNRRGVRVYNEKLNYNERTKAHFDPDGRFLLGIFDQHSFDHFAAFAGHITPLRDTLIGPAAGTADLKRQIAERMSLDPATSAFWTGSPLQELDPTIERFGEFARSGVDADFHRGETTIDRWWHAFCLNFGVNAEPAGVRDCISANVDENGNPYPNITMRPLRPPLYAVILSSGLQDTKGGPAIDAAGRVLDGRGRPVPGLYGAGNCVASLAGEGYWGAGGTLGPAVVFGHIAGRSAARAPAFVAAG